MPTSTLTNVADVGQAVAGLAAVGALLYGARQLRLTRKLAREEKVGFYLERLNSAEFFDRLSASRDSLAIAEDLRDGCWAKFRSASRREQQEYFGVVNLLEEIATLYNDGLLDERATRRLLGDLSLQYWEEIGWFIERYRRIDPLAASEWSEMNRRLVSAQRISGGWRGRLRLGTPWRVGDLFAPLEDVA